MAAARSVVLGVVSDPLIYGLLDDVLSTQHLPFELFFDDATAALHRIETGDIAVVVLDLGWPEAQGLEFCERLWSLPTAIRPPVVALTDFPADNWDVLGFACGPQKYLTKPFHVADLVSLITRYLPPG
jgi:DNA-binding response OmpR family regulator